MQVFTCCLDSLAQLRLGWSQPHLGGNCCRNFEVTFFELQKPLDRPLTAGDGRLLRPSPSLVHVAMRGRGPQPLWPSPSLAHVAMRGVPFLSGAHCRKRKRAATPWLSPHLGHIAMRGSGPHPEPCRGTKHFADCKLSCVPEVLASARQS